MGGSRVCLFGGTFDPIHNAHLEIADEALRRFSLSEIVFVPAANPPHKTSEVSTPYADRLRMVELACAGHPAFSVSRLEEHDGKSYTVETLEKVRAAFEPGDELFFLIGADAFDELETWHRWRDVLKLTEFIIVSRPGTKYHIPEGARVVPLEGLSLPVSSSTIRGRLAEGADTPEVPSQVRRYIEERGLYGVAKSLTA
jgi:nicotinate-nucleotide adenylyltransferase